MVDSKDAYTGVMSATVLVAKPPLVPRTRRSEWSLFCY